MRVAEFLTRLLWETWAVFKEASIFLLLGFMVAGLLAVLVPARTLVRFFGTGRIRSVLWASAFGTPLPLCSCGVIPAALGLRRQGATKGATVAFLISTPETGLDSISLTYALMDPILTVFRPVAAMVTGVIAGIATNFWGNGKRVDGPDQATPGLETHQAGMPAQDAHTGGEQLPLRRHGPARRVFAYAFGELLDETSHWLVLGIVLSAVVAVVLPPSVVERYLGGELTTMLLMLLIGTPLYICASSATPIAAALVLKGLNPGAALVFLLAGPATNLGTIVVLLRFLGRRIVAIYLASIVAVSLAAGYALNWVYRAWGLDPRATFGAASGFVPEEIKVAAALVLIPMLLFSMRRAAVPQEWLRARDALGSLTGLRVTARGLKAAAAVAVLGLYLSGSVFTVQPGEVGMRLRFGRIVTADLAPGLHVRLPWPFESHRVVQADLVRRVELGFRSTVPANRAERALARERLTIGGPSNPVPQAIQAPGFWFQKEKVAEESFLLTGDGNILDISAAVQYQVKDPVAYAYNVADPDRLVQSVALSVLRGLVGTMGIDAIYSTARSGIEREAAAIVQQLLDAYEAGVQVASVRLLYVHPPEEVHGAFRDVASAQEDKMHITNRSMIFATEKVNLAEGEAAAMAEMALSFKEAKILQAQGDAAAFSLRAGEYRRAPDVTRFRLHLETAEQVLPRVQKFLRPGAGDIKDVDLWLVNPFAAKKSE
jgi:HflK protein